MQNKYIMYAPCTAAGMCGWCPPSGWERILPKPVWGVEMRRNNNFERIQIANWDLGHADFKHETFSRTFLSRTTYIDVSGGWIEFYAYTTKQHVSLKCALYISLLRNEQQRVIKTNTHSVRGKKKANLSCSLRCENIVKLFRDTHMWVG